MSLFCRFMFIAISTTSMLELKKEADRIYSSLPFYHMENLMTSVGPSITHAIPVAMRGGFSAEHYFSDCKKFRCTVSYAFNI